MKKIHILPLLNGFGRLDKIAFVPCTVIDYDMVHIPLMDDSMWKCLKPFNSIKNMANYKNQTGISFIIAEKEDGTYDVNMGSNADLPHDGLPVKLYTGIMQAVCDYVEEHNTKKTCSCSAPKLIERMLVVIKKIAQTKQEVNKASNQIAAYEIGQQMGELVDELVSLYDEIEQK